MEEITQKEVEQYYQELAAIERLTEVQEAIKVLGEGSEAECIINHKDGMTRWQLVDKVLDYRIRKEAAKYLNGTEEEIRKKTILKNIFLKTKTNDRNKSQSAS
jgi:hypothetical protein